MISEALKMTYAQKKQRAEEKRRILLDFLASGEVYTTIPIIAELLQISASNALRLVKTLTAEKILRVDEDAVPLSNLKLYGITAHGIAVTESAHPLCREFRIGATNSSFLMHHLDGQRIRILAERAGWQEWVPGRILMVENSKRLKKLPDALATRPGGHRVAIEVERHIKSRRRMAEVVGAHLQQILAGNYALVYYFTSHQAALDRVMQAVEYMIIDGSKVKLTEAHRARFKNFDIKNPNLN